MSKQELAAYLSFATALAKECGEVIIEGSKARYMSQSNVLEKGGNALDLVTETDKKVEAIVQRKLSAEYPTHKFIGEETVAAGQESILTDEPTWIVDPIDGTTNFVHGFPFVAISIGLVISKEPVVGVVYNPFLNEMYTASKGNGAYLNHTTRLPPSYPNPPLRLPPSLSQCLIGAEYGSDRRPTTIDKKVNTVHNMLSQPGQNNWSSKKAALVRGIRSVGSAALNLCLVARGDLDVYWEFGCWEWDVAAGIVIVSEAGGIVVDANGPDEGPVNILGRRFLAVRGGSPNVGDSDTRSGQLRIVKDLWDVIEELELPRK